jgi:hypothetical protein
MPRSKAPVRDWSSPNATGEHIVQTVVVAFMAIWGLVFLAATVVIPIWLIFLR